MLRRAAAVLCLAVPAALAAPASAAPLAVTGFSVGTVDRSGSPVAPVAGSHQDVQIVQQLPTVGVLDAPPHVKRLVIRLPAGLVGSPNAVPRCDRAAFQADACPAATRVGSVAVKAKIKVAAVPVPLDAAGDVYNLAPAGSEPARLGVMVRPLNLTRIALEAPTALDPSTGSLTSTIDGIPTQSSGLETWIETVTLTLLGTPAGRDRPFLYLPTSCAAQAATVTATAYDGATASRTAPFAATGCDRLPFAPFVSAAFSGPGGAGSKPGVRAATGVPAGTANVRRAAITLPSQVRLALGSIGSVCPSAQFDAGACPAAAQLGSASAATPLLPEPLAGAVYLVSPAGGGLPGIGVALRGPISLNLRGSVILAPSGAITNVFDGLPDVPLSRFELLLSGGPGGPLNAVESLCTGPVPVVLGEFVAQTGARAARRATASAAGCPRTPAVIVRLRGRRTRTPGLSLIVTAARTAPALRVLRIGLPRSLRLDRRRLGRGLAITVRGARLRRGVSVLRSGALRIALPPGTPRVTVKAVRGALRSRSRRGVGTGPQRLRLVAWDARGTRVARTLRVRASRR